jgi:hypothetical protein
MMVLTNLFKIAKLFVDDSKLALKKTTSNNYSTP